MVCENGHLSFYRISCLQVVEQGQFAYRANTGSESNAVPY